MPLMPLIFRDFYPEFGRPHRLLDQHFGVDLDMDDLLSPLTLHPQRRFLGGNYYRPWRSTVAQRDTGSTIVNHKEKFQVSIDVQQFSPDEITVKTANNNTVIIEGKHDEKQDEHGFISRHFVRRYILPAGHDAKDVVSSLSSDGVLTIIAPKQVVAESSERVVPITQTGPLKTCTETMEENKE